MARSSSIPLFAALVWSFAARLALALNNETTPVSFFYSRPDLQASAMKVTVADPDKYDAGYVFVTPYQQPQSGPYIFDKKGNLVWSGYADIGPFNAHDFYVCQYKGSDHLCMFQGNQHFGYARGHGIILNSDYKIIKTVHSVGDLPPLDQHEFKVVDGGKTAYITIYQQIPYDLSRLDIKGTGWIMNSVFQVVNVEDNSLQFEWKSLDHVEPWGSYVYPRTSDISGTGNEPQKPWDYFHINSVDKSKITGNYIISARHMSSIYNINATDGSIIWKLEAGGDSNFTCKGFNFTFQHDAQIRHENSTHMLLSIFDNSSNNFNKTATRSAGKYIRLDLENWTAELYRNTTMYSAQDVLCASQGNTQHLEKSGNTFNGWGDWPRFSEFAPDGQVVWEAEIGPGQGKNMVYRAFTFPWKSIPAHSNPSLWTYSMAPDRPTAFYVSWNGCTETARWRFYAANDVNDKFTLVGYTDRVGFETRYQAETHFRYAFAEAVGPDGESLRNSSLAETFVPGSKLMTECGEWECGGPKIS